MILVLFDNANTFSWGIYLQCREEFNLVHNQKTRKTQPIDKLIIVYQETIQGGGDIILQ